MNSTKNLVKKAIIPAAGFGTRMFPASLGMKKEFFPVIDRDGLTKPVIQIIAEEAFSAGIEEICIICAPGDEARYRQTFNTLQSNLLKAFKNVGWAQNQADRLILSAFLCAAANYPNVVIIGRLWHSTCRNNVAVSIIRA